MTRPLLQFARNISSDIVDTYYLLLSLFRYTFTSIRMGRVALELLNIQLQLVTS